MDDIRDDESVEDYLRRRLEEGIEVTAEDFEGRPCSFCGDLIEFAAVQRDADAMVTWDIRVQEPGDDEPDPYVARHYFCSDECKQAAKGDPEWISGEGEHGSADHIHVDQLEGMA